MKMQLCMMKTGVRSLILIIFPVESSVRGFEVETIARESMAIARRSMENIIPEMNDAVQVPSSSSHQNQIMRENSFNNKSTSCESNRFAQPVSDETLKRMKVISKPANTQNRNGWALRQFNEWKTNIMNLKTEPEFPENNFVCWDKESLNYWLAKFITETRKKDGTRYLRNSLVSLIAGLQQVLHFNDNRVDFFRGMEFINLRECLDASMIESTKENVGRQERKSDTISNNEEDILWEKKQLGKEDPAQLMQTLFYLNGINFAIRGGKEHSDLLIEQFRIEMREGLKALVYQEGVIKTFKGGLNQRRSKSKVKVHFENKDNPERCHVKLFEFFMRKRNPQCNRFYQQAKTNVKQDDNIWFTTRPMGHNTLKNLLKTMTKKANIEGRKTNHSLKATCATRLYDAGVDEQLIMERTGHTSVMGVRAYKRTSNFLIKNTSMILNNQDITAAMKKVCGRNNEEKSPNLVCNFNIRNCNVTIINSKTRDSEKKNDN